MSDLDDLKQENAQLKIQLKSNTDKIDSMLEIAHNLRKSISTASGFAKLLKKRTLDPESLQAALDQIERACAQSVLLIQSLQERGYVE